MKLKLDAEGHAVLQDGKPVYVHDDGKEVAFDAPFTVATINRLNGEAKGHREAKEAAEARLKGFEGIEDAEAARKALETISNLDAGQLKTAQQVEEIRREAAKAAEQKVADAAKASTLRIQELEGDNKKLAGEYDQEKVTNAFANSKFIREKVAAPLDMVQAMFGARFKREDGKLVGYDATGNKIYSRTKPGELADFDEAFEMTVDAYPNRDSILKGTGSSGGGSNSSPNRGGGNGGQKTMPRSEFNNLAPLKQGEIVRSGTSIVD